MTGFGALNTTFSRLLHPMNHVSEIRFPIRFKADNLSVEQRVLALRPEFADACDRLAAYGIPETVQHDDLHDGNVFVRDGRYLFLDWGDSCVSHPLHSLVVTLRAIVWKQWRRGRTRYAELRRRGVGRDLAAQSAGSPHGPWRLINSPALTIALSNAFLGSLGLASLATNKAAC